MSVVRAEAAQAAAESTSESLRKRLEEAGAERRVLQDSVKAMRQKCTERWVRGWGRQEEASPAVGVSGAVG